MPDYLYWNTVTPLLRETLLNLMESPVFNAFRLVGGTSLSLQIGHRISVDIDLFTDAVYNSIDFEIFDVFFKESFPYVIDNNNVGIIGMGQSYKVGTDQFNNVKIDLYYTDTFIRPPLLLGPLRLATIDEIAAMKMDVVQRVARRKDFWDLHELLDRFTIQQLIDLHAERYPYSHEPALLLQNLDNFQKAENDFDPKCLRGKYWDLIMLDLQRAKEQFLSGH